MPLSSLALKCGRWNIVDYPTAIMLLALFKRVTVTSSTDTASSRNSIRLTLLYSGAK